MVTAYSRESLGTFFESGLTSRTYVRYADGMDRPRIHGLVDTLLSAERGVGDEAAAKAVLTAGRQLRSFVDACEQIATWNLAQLAADGRSAPVTDTLRDSGRSSAEARAAGRRAAACASHPGFHEALASGSIATGHVDALAAGAIATGHVDALARATARLTDVGRSNLT